VVDVRAALGYMIVSLYGGSDGTRLAQAYLRRFPSQGGSVVLDGVVPFDNAVPVTYAANAQRSLERVFAACAKSAPCQSAHPHTGADFERLLQRFDAGPIATHVSMNGAVVPVRMSRGDLGYAVRGMLYYNVVARLPDMIAHAAETGDVSEFATAYWKREADLEPAIAFGLHLSVFCAEDVPFPSEHDIEAATAHTFLGRYLFDEYRAACREWPRAPIAPDARTPVASKVPTLLVSGAFDPVTPPAFAESVQHGLAVSLALVATDGSHGSTFGCPRQAVLYVLERGMLAGAPTVCK